MATVAVTTLMQVVGCGQVKLSVTRCELEATALRFVLADAIVCWRSDVPAMAPELARRLDRLAANSGVFTTWPMLSARFWAGVWLGFQPTGRKAVP